MMDTRDFSITISKDFKSQSNKFALSKIEDELYKEDQHIVMPIVRVKHISLPNKGDRWRIYKNDKQVIVVEGTKLNKKERVYLRSLEGVSFLIAEVKAGAGSFHAVKTALKKHMKVAKPKKK
jgi:hypothetical protein